MDTQDSTAPPPRLTHLHHPLPPPPSHPAAVLLGPHSQSQQHLPKNSYPLANTNNAVNPTTTIMHHQNPGFPFKSILAGGGPKKRGRPSKNSLDNSSPAPVFNIPWQAAHNDASAGRGRGRGGGSGGTPSSGTSYKRKSVKPPRPVKIESDDIGVPGYDLTPYVVPVNVGEDISSIIMAFCQQQGLRTVTILSATGDISNVTLLPQSKSSAGIVTYEGRFAILTMSGSICNGSGVLNISLAGADHSVLGGRVAGMLTAASPVVLTLGTFIAKQKKSKGRETSKSA